ncbi:MAG: PEP-CTERM sorting domain-containing protein [Verrucomicrobiota bacterium]
MSPSPIPHRAHLDHRLQSLGLGTVAATAAGLAFTPKAEAAIVYTGTGLTDPNTPGAVLMTLDGTNILFSSGFPTTMITGFGFQIVNYSGSTLGLVQGGDLVNGTITYVYQFLATNDPTATGQFPTINAVFFTETQTFLLSNATLNTNFVWGSLGANIFPPVIPNSSFYFGLRRVGLGTTEYGWAEVQFGSVTVVSAAFNTTNNGSIAIGQIPEPSSTLLLAAGATGLLNARRRRKKAA